MALKNSRGLELWKNYINLLNIIYFFFSTVKNYNGPNTPAPKKKVAYTFDRTHLRVCNSTRWIRNWGQFEPYTLKITKNPNKGKKLWNCNHSDDICGPRSSMIFMTNKNFISLKKIISFHMYFTIHWTWIWTSISPLSRQSLKTLQKIEKKCKKIVKCNFKTQKCFVGGKVTVK